MRTTRSSPAAYRGRFSEDGPACAFPPRAADHRQLPLQHFVADLLQGCSSTATWFPSASAWSSGRSPYGSPRGPDRRSTASSRCFCRRGTTSNTSSPSARRCSARPEGQERRHPPAPQCHAASRVRRGAVRPHREGRLRPAAQDDPQCAPGGFRGFRRRRHPFFTRRAEQLSVADFVVLTNWVAEHRA